MNDFEPDNPENENNPKAPAIGWAITIGLFILFLLTIASCRHFNKTSEETNDAVHQLSSE